MSEPTVTRFANGPAGRATKLLAVACVAVVAACASIERAPVAAPQPAPAPTPSVGDLAAARSCIDQLLLDFGPRDLSVRVEDLADPARRGGSRDLLVSVASALTQRSRAIRFVAPPFDRDPSAAAPPYTLRGSVSEPASPTSTLALDLMLLNTKDMSVVPGSGARNTVTLVERGAELRKYGVAFSVPTGANDGREAALRALAELTTIELLGRLARVPYWSCFGATTADPEIAAEVQGWYDAMAANPAEIIGYFQRQLRARRVYAGAVDGVVSPALKDAVARYREALGLSREPKLSLDFLQAHLSADPRALEARLTPPAPAATPVAVADTALALRISSVKASARFGAGEAVQLSVRPSRDAYVYCFYQDENRRLSRVFPNRFQREARVAAAVGLQLPGAMRFEIVMNARGKPESVACFATERDVLAQLPDAIKAGDFDPLAVATLDPIRTAFLNVTGGALAQDSFQLRSR